MGFMERNILQMPLTFKNPLCNRYYKFKVITQRERKYLFEPRKIILSLEKSIY